MQKNFANRTKETTNSTDTAVLVLGGAVNSSWRAFIAKLAAGTTGIEVEVGPDAAGNWVIGTYTLTDATHLTRTSLDDYSPGAAGGVLAAGAKEVTNIISADRMATIVTATDTPFSVVVPFATGGDAYMPPTQVAGALVFSVAANPVKNSRVYLRLTANGGTAPDFSAFRRWGGSAWNNSSGITNEVQFFFDGSESWIYSTQAEGAVPTPAAATGVTMTGPTTSVNGVASSNFTLGVTPVGGTITGTVRITPASTVGGDTFTPAYRDVSNGTPSGTFTVTASSTGARTISCTNNGGLTNPATLTLTVSAAATAPTTMAAPTATAGDSTASIAYVVPSDGGSSITGYTVTPYIGATAQTAQTFGVGAGPVTCTGLTNGSAYTFKIHASNAAGAGTDSPASNSVTPVAAAIPRLISLSGVTQGGSSPNFNYLGGNGNYAPGIPGPGGVSNLHSTSGAAFSFACTNSQDVGLIVGIKASSALTAYDSLPMGLFAASSGTVYKAISGGAVVNGNISAATGCLYGDHSRVVYEPAAATLTAQISRSAAPNSWIDIHQFTGVTPADYYVHVLIAGNITVSALTATGLV